MMGFGKTIYTVTHKIRVMDIKYRAHRELGEYYVKKNKHKLAVKSFVNSEKIKNDMFLEVVREYPRLKNRYIRVEYKSNEITILD